jgi:hypothetical protein
VVWREVVREEEVLLPSGDRLTVERFQTVGLELGMASGFDGVHFLLEEAFLPQSDGTVLSDRFLTRVEALTSFATQPLFAVMHEPIYGQGAATRWAAERVRHEFPEFAPDAEAPLFTGEMIYPWQFDQDSALVPLKPAAELLARRSDWLLLYDADRLSANQVPVAAAVYYEDMYVDRELSLDTAARIGRCRTWVTNEYQHDGLRQGAFPRLLDLARGRV